MKTLQLINHWQALITGAVFGIIIQGLPEINPRTTTVAFSDYFSVPGPTLCFEPFLSLQFVDSDLKPSWGVHSGS